MDSERDTRAVHRKSLTYSDGRSGDGWIINY
jgi:hypothetical protein